MTANPGAPVTPDTLTAVQRVLTMRDVTTFVACDTAAALADRVRNLLAARRRITTATHLLYPDGNTTVVPEVTVGLTPSGDPIWRETELGMTFTVELGTSLLDWFGFSASRGIEDTVKQVATRFHRQHRDARRDATEIRIVGGMPGDTPARDDQITLRFWNSSGVCRVLVVAFDYGTCEVFGPVHQTVSGYAVTAHPQPESDGAGAHTIDVHQYHGDQWVAVYGDFALDFDGRWVYGRPAGDGMPSWPLRCTHTRDDALHLARNAALSSLPSMR